jgi:hypothetical protein
MVRRRWLGLVAVILWALSAAASGGPARGAEPGP